MDAATIFKDEFALITDLAIQKFVSQVFDFFTPNYFESAPASITGKHHPQISLGQGGLVRHTKLAVWWGVKLSKVWGLSQNDLEVIVAALLLHDLQKFGPTLSSDGTKSIDNPNATHGLIFSKKLFEYVIGHMSLNEWKIVDAIRYHMGRWTAPESKDTPEQFLHSPTRLIVHLADYVAAQKIDEALLTIATSSPSSKAGEAGAGSPPPSLYS